MLTVRGDDRLKAVSLALRQARRDVRNETNRQVRATMSPVWQNAVQSRARTDLDRKVIAQGARILAGNPPVLVAAGSRRKLKGGLIPTDTWQPLEFGADREEVSTYDRRTKHGGTTSVTRHTARQMPSRTRKGRIAWSAAKELAPRLASLFAQTVVRTFADAVDRAAR
ncbi:MAG: hypothetical protein KJ792_04180 [Actinobacteria bacterium]|nr:hypothetical protein [Actinomycetota bacterium]